MLSKILNRNILRAAAVVALAAAVSAIAPACSSSRNAASAAAGKQSSTKVTGNRPGKSDVKGEWSNVQMPVKVSLRSPARISLSGRATMVRDSAVNISMRVFGMEVGVINLTADSVWVVDKYHKFMFAESTRALLGRHEMSIGRIQQLMLGIDTGATDGVLSCPNSGDREPVTISFANLFPTPLGMAAQEVAVSAPAGRTDVEASLRWDLESAKWNEPGRRINFSAPTGRGYRRVGLAEALEMFKSL